jgi:hypothetical protein
MKYPPAPLTPFLAALLCIRRRIHILSEPEPKGLDRLTPSTSVACSLLKSLASLFPPRFLYFQSLAVSFRKTPGRVGYCVPLRRLRALRACPLWRVSALSFAVLESVLVFKNLQVAPSTPSICIPRVFMHLQIPFSATRVFSQTSALPPSFPLLSPLATRLPRAEPRGTRHSSLATSLCLGVDPMLDVRLKDTQRDGALLQDGVVEGADVEFGA